MILLSACYQIYQENIRTRFSEKKTEESIFDPISEREENECFEEYDEGATSHSESHSVATFSDCPSKKS